MTEATSPMPGPSSPPSARGTDAPRAGQLGLPVLVGFALTSATLLGAQLVLSRVFASTLGCYYAFALVSLAMLGLGAGGLFVQLLPRWFAPEHAPRQASVALLAMSASCFAALLLYLRLYPHVAHGSWLVALGVFGGFFPFFLAAGIVVSIVLALGRAHFHRLYALDLGAAALGALGAVVALGVWHPVEATLYLLALVPLVAALAFAVASRSRALMFAAGLGLVVATPLAIGLLRSPEFADPPHVSRIGWRRLHHSTSTMANVSVFESTFFTWALSPAYSGPKHRMIDLLIDGVGGTEIVEFDGRVETLRSDRYAYLEQDMTSLAQTLVPPDGRHLIIGPGGGVDILQSVRRGRGDVTAVEINPLVARMVNQELGEFSGRPYQLPGVRVVIENGRTFALRTEERWRLISLTWVDTGGQASAMASSENYLYTVESYQRFLDRLEPEGYFAFMRALGLGGDLTIDGVRGVSVAVEALRRLGVTDPSRHLVASAVASPFFGGRAMLYVAVKRTPLTSEETAAAHEFMTQHHFVPVWLPGGVSPETKPSFAERIRLIQEIVTTTDPERLHAEAPLDVAPSTDDNPFYFVERAGVNRQAGAGVGLLQRNLTVLLSLVVPFMLLPMLPVAFRTRRLGRRGGAALLFFSLLGIGVMLVEVELFQVYALVLGNPTAAIVTVLSTLLLASGAGSLFAAQLARARLPLVWSVFGALVVLLAGFALGKTPLLHALVALPFPLRVAGTMFTLAPLAFLMGLPLATGMTWIAERRDLVLWGWALNGSLGVLASVIAVYSALHVGFASTFLAGVAFYALAGLAAPFLRARGDELVAETEPTTALDATTAEPAE